METCLYHRNKCHFDIFNRDIVKAKIIPRNYSRRLAMCVCSCRKNKFNLNKEVKQLELQDMAHCLETLIKTENWPVTVVSLVKPLLFDVSLLQYSHSVMILVLYRAIKNKNYDLLESLMVKTKETVKKTQPTKITPLQFKYMLNKKWKDSHESLDVILPMFAGNTKLLQNDVNFKEMQSNNKDVVIKIDHKANTDFIRNNVKKTKIRLGGKNKDEVYKVGKILIKIGGDIQKCLDVNHAKEVERIKIQKAIRKERKLEYLLEEQTDRYLFTEQYKDDVRDMYVRRNKHHGNDKKCKSPADSPLKDGHCMNCLDRFVTLKHPDECKYHPGFIGLDTHWSCCGILAESEQPTLKEHKDTGCFTSVHNWRHGKDIKKTKKHRNVSKDFKSGKQGRRKHNDIDTD